MATFTAISTKTQSQGAMKGSLNYVMQKKKTTYLNPDTGQRYKLVSGQNCMEKDMDYQTRRLSEIVHSKLSESERDIQRTVSKQNSDMREKMEMQDLSPIKLKIKWVLIGAALPSALLLWELLSRLW